MLIRRLKVSGLLSFGRQLPAPLARTMTWR